MQAKIRTYIEIEKSARANYNRKSTPFISINPISGQACMLSQVSCSSLISLIFFLLPLISWLVVKIKRIWRLLFRNLNSHERRRCAMPWFPPFFKSLFKTILIHFVGLYQGQYQKMFLWNFKNDRVAISFEAYFRPQCLKIIKNVSYKN